jgi:hypothetical protein
MLMNRSFLMVLCLAALGGTAHGAAIHIQGKLLSPGKMQLQSLRRVRQWRELCPLEVASHEDSQWMAHCPAIHR